MKRLLLMLSLVVGLASTALAVDQVVFVAQGASYDGTATKVTIPTGEITNKTFTAEGVCSVSHEKKNNSSSQVTGNLVRWYANDVMTITPVEGISISKIEINCSTTSYADVLGKVTVNGNKFTVSGSVASYEPSEVITGSFSFAPTAQVRFSSIVISYVGDVIPVAPKLPVVTFGDVTAENNGKYEVVEGTEVSVTSAGADYLLVTKTTGLTKERIEGNTYSFAVNADDTWEFTGGNGTGSSETFKVTFTTVPAPKTGGVVYTLVKSASELVAGETYTIACADKNMAMSNANQANYRPQTEVNIVNGKFEVNNDILAFTLEGEAGNWNMKTVNYGSDANGYFDLSSTAKDNYLLVTDTPRAWSITIDDSNNAEIKSALNTSTTRYIKYNASATRFATYTSGQAAVQLYREEVVAPGIYFNGEQLEAGASPELKAGDKIVIRGHEANELHYKLLNSAMRAPSANLDGWYMSDSNEFEYEVPEGFENMSISLAAKAVNNGKESAPVQFVVSEGTMTGVAGVEAEAADAQTEWFTLQGVRVAAPAEGGLYIRRQGSKVEKVVL